MFFEHLESDAFLGGKGDGSNLQIRTVEAMLSNRSINTFVTGVLDLLVGSVRLLAHDRRHGRDQAFVSGSKMALSITCPRCK